MSKTPRYDRDRDKTRHGVTDRSQCEEIEEKYKWVLTSIEPSSTKDLPWDCVFEGYREFPPGGLDWSQGDAMKTQRELEDE